MHKIGYKNLKKTLIVFLNHMESHNAFDIEMAEELIDLVQKEQPKSLVLTNKGSSFCAGGNLKFYQNLKSKEEGLEVNKRIRKILSELYQLKIPKACFVNGPCYGGGIELVSCFDYIVASPQSLFGLWQRRIGLSFGWGGGKRLLKRMDEAALKEWLLSAGTLSSYEAKSMGLVDKVCLSSQALEACVRWAENTYSHGEQSFKECKNIFEDEKKVFEKLWHSEKHKSVLNKFK